MHTRNSNISKSPLETMKQREQFNKLFNRHHAPLQGSCSPYANFKGQQANYRLSEVELMTRHKRQIAEINGLTYKQQDSPCKNDYFRSNNRIAKLMGSAKTTAKQSGQTKKNAQEGKSQCSSATTAISMVNYSKAEGKKPNQRSSNRNTKNKNSAASIKLLGKRKRGQSDLLETRQEENKHNSYQTQQIDCLTCDKLSPLSMNEIGDLTQNEASCERSMLSATDKVNSRYNNQGTHSSRHQQNKEVISQQFPTKKFKFINLKDKHNSIKQRFKLYNEKDLTFLKARREAKGKLILDFNMNKLELEYDYDTDCDQLMTAKEMLVQETISAVEFCVKEDPLLLVGNLNEY